MTRTPDSAPAAEWVAAPPAPAAAALERAGVDPLLAVLLACRGVADAAAAEAFLRPSLDQLADPLRLAGMREALDRLERAAGQAEKVAIVGDYDVDGVTATALLAAVFAASGIEPRPILPHRLEEGYGFQPVHAERAAAAGCTVVVTADCGSSSDEAVAAARRRGLDVVITDHHLLTGGGPQGAVVINPKRDDCDYPFRDLCGAGLAFQLARGLGERLGAPADPERLLRVACLGTICDLVPLRGENRVIAALGLAALPRTPSPGLRALFGAARVRLPLTAADVGYRIGPRLNAAGRMAEPEPALELLLERDPRRAEELAGRLERLNSRRRGAEEAVVEGARERFASLDRLPGILVAWDESWHRGVVGIAAGRLAREFHRPTVLLCPDGASATGSGRSVDGIHLYETVAAFADRLERFGGHAQAVGLTVPTADLDALRADLEAAAERFDPELLLRRLRYEAAPPPESVDRALLERIERLAPFGVGNRRPLLRIGPLRGAGTPRRFGRGNLALAATGPRGGRVDLVAWGWADREALFGEPFEVLGSLELDRYEDRPAVRVVDARRVA